MIVWLALAAITLIWGTTFAVVRFGLQELGPLTGLALRFLAAGLVLTAIAAHRGVLLPRGRVERRLLWVNAVGSFAVPYLLLYWAEQWVPSGLVALLFSTYPLWVALAAQAWLPEERLGRRGAAGLVGGFAGVAVMLSEDLDALAGPGVRAVAAVFLASPAAAAAASVSVRRWGGSMRPLTLTALPILGTGIAAAVGAWMYEAPPAARPSWPAILSVAYLAVAGTVFCFLVYFWLLRRIEAVRLSLITYVIPVLAVALGAVWLGEPVTVRVVVGGCLVLAGVAVVAARRRRVAAPAA